DVLLVAPGFNLLEADGEPILEEIGAVYGFDGASSQGDVDAKDFGLFNEKMLDPAPTMLKATAT
ncbi:MAG: hypothetical protein ACPGGD_04420, partial [Thalassolituus sp.]